MNYVLCWVGLTLGAFTVSDYAFGISSAEDTISRSFDYAVALLAMAVGEYAKNCYVAWKARQ